MTRIRATCPTCGEVELLPADIELIVVGAAIDRMADGSHYVFMCPTCVDAITKPADDRIARLLVSGGVSVSYIESELAARALAPHPEVSRPGPVFTMDDLLDFHELLQSENWFAELEALVS